MNFENYSVIKLKIYFVSVQVTSDAHKNVNKDYKLHKKKHHH